jgi:hypothetical protein
MTKLTVAGLIDFVCSQDPAREVNDTRWSNCAVGDYARSIDISVEWLSEGGKLSAFGEFVRHEFQTYFSSKTPDPRLVGAFAAVYEIDERIGRNYGHIQASLIESGLVADPDKKG